MENLKDVSRKFFTPINVAYLNILSITYTRYYELFLYPYPRFYVFLLLNPLPPVLRIILSKFPYPRLLLLISLKFSYPGIMSDLFEITLPPVIHLICLLHLWNSPAPCTTCFCFEIPIHPDYVLLFWNSLTPGFMCYVVEIPSHPV